MLKYGQLTTTVSERTGETTDMTNETDIAVDENRYSKSTTPAVEAGDILEDGLGNEYQVIIDQCGHAELRLVTNDGDA